MYIEMNLDHIFSNFFLSLYLKCLAKYIKRSRLYLQPTPLNRIRSSFRIGINLAPEPNSYFRIHVGLTPTTCIGKFLHQNIRRSNSYYIRTSLSGKLSLQLKWEKVFYFSILEAGDGPETFSHQLVMQYLEFSLVFIS